MPAGSGTGYEEAAGGGYGGLYRPIRAKAEAIRNDHAYLRRIMEAGADKARASAAATMALVRESMGLNYY